MKGGKSLLDRPVQGQKLTDKQELGLCLHIDHMDDICFPLHQENIDACANAILAQSHIDPHSLPEPVGSKWTMQFLLRHPEYKTRIQKFLDIDSLKAHQPEIIRIWFNKLKKALAKYNILLENCYNMDKTGFRIGTGGKQRIITRNTRWRCFVPSSTNREFVTVVECISASQHVLPLMVILPGKTLLEVYIENTDMPGDFSLAVSESGYTNDDLCFHWLKHFEQQSAKRPKGEYRLLIMDGSDSHCTLDFIQYCHSHKIIPFCLPPNATHIL
jgi:hypothetical protein